MNILVRGTHGGVGVTTTAIAMAARLAERDGSTVAIVGGFDDSARIILGLREGDNEIKVGTGKIVLRSYSIESDDHVIGDGGPHGVAYDGVLWVARNDYLSAKRLSAWLASDARWTDDGGWSPYFPENSNVLLITENGRALSVRDFQSAADLSYLETPYDVAVGRAIDAGVLHHKIPRMFRNAIDVMIGRLESSLVNS